MGGSNFSSAGARPEAEIFAELSSLCTMSGYIHAIAYFCWRDNLIRYAGPQVIAKDLEHQHSHDKLIRTEISALIGLMVRKPIDLSLPKPEITQAFIVRTETLLRELHDAMIRPWREGWEVSAGKRTEVDWFANAAALREPIFYGGESAYNFQYREFARLKYREDDNWLDANKGFRIDEACQIGEALGNLHSKRVIECDRSFRKQVPHERTMLPAFQFSAEDVAAASQVAPEKVERFLNTFSCGPDESNIQFTSVNEINVTNSSPIIKTKGGLYILLQSFSLLEAIYESPFYWLAQDPAYSSIASINRGRFTESFVADRLDIVFGNARVLRNINIYKGKNRFAEIDALVVYGDRAIVVQAKSKRLTIESRKGNDYQLKDDFKRAVQDAYDQTLLCAEALTSNDYKFVTQSGREIKKTVRPRLIFPVCVVSDHYPALAFQARHFLKTNTTSVVQAPLITDVFAVDAITEMLNTPLNLLNYLALRARFGEKIFATNELTILGLHLRQNLWLDPQLDGLALDESLASNLDIAMLARRDGVPGEKTPEGILTRFDGLTIGRLLSEIERIASPQLTGLGLLLLQLSSQTAKFLSAGIDRIVGEARFDGTTRDISVGVDAGGSGITVHCNSLPEGIAREQLSAHCNVRKYDTKANSWYGLLLAPGTGRIRGALAFEHNWKSDSNMESIMKSWQKRQPIQIGQPASGSGKIGRNTLCSCGSGKKYKRCCLNA